MKNLFSFLLVLLAVILFAGSANAQLSGTKNIPGDYATISAAVTALNASGVGAGGVTFNVAAGHTENTTAQILITATGTAANPITFQRSGVGVNPKITRTDAGSNTTSSLGALGDAVIRLNSTDYITFDGIDVAASNSGIEYGYFTFKTSTTDGCKFVTIKNCNITMLKGSSGFVVGINISNGPASVSAVTGVAATTEPGANNDIVITGNTIQNVHTGIYLRGATGYYDYNYTIGSSGAGNTITNYGGGSATATYGVYFIYVSTASVGYSTINNASGGSAHGSTLYGIFFSTVNGVIAASNNAITLSNSTTGGAFWIYNANTCTSEEYNNNTFAAGTFTSTSTSQVSFIYSSNATNDKTISGNQTSGTITKTGTAGSFYCYYNSGSPTGGTETFTNNNFSNISVSGSSALYGLYSSSSTTQSRVCSGNTISNLTTVTGACYPLYLLSSLTNQINNNSVSNITAGGAVYGLYFTGTSPTVYENTIYNVTSSGTTYGIYNGSGTVTTNCYRNKVSNVTNNSGTAALYGIYATSGTSNNIYNNYISELYAPSLSSTTNNLTGIYISAGTSIGVFYNTVYLDATGAGANFGSSAIYASVTPTVELRNNIFVNNSTPNGSGLAVAYRRSSTNAGTYFSGSNNNDFYAGTIYYDGTTSYPTITDFKNLVSPIDNASFSELPPFVDVAAMPYDLHIGTVVQTQCESGGSVVSTEASIAITNDYDNHARYPNPGYPDDILHPATAPDVGADEFAGNPKDLIGPSITYTPLGNTASTGARTLTAEITDPSGVPIAGGGLPVLYWRINSGSWSNATASSLGGNQYQFSFGAGVSISNIIQYYICAQDLLNNVSAYPSAGASGFAPNPPSVSTPPTTPSSYLIVGGLAAGNYLIGGSGSTPAPGCTYVDLTSAFADINQVVLSIDVVSGGSGYTTAPTVAITGGGGSGATAIAILTDDAVSSVTITNRGTGYSSPPTVTFTGGGGADADASANVSAGREILGAVNFLLTSDYNPAEEDFFPIVINPVTGAGAVNPVTVKPNTGLSRTITGSGTAVIKLAGSDYIVFDGSNSGGTDRSLTIENTNAANSTSAVWISSLGLGAGATYNTIKNCNIKTGSPTLTTSGISISGTGINTTTGALDNNYNTIQNNSISKTERGIYAGGLVAGEVTGLVITGNSIGSNTAADYITVYGIYGIGLNAPVITNNEIFNMISDDSKYGIYFSTNVHDAVISKNKIHTFDVDISTSTSLNSTGIYFSSGTGNTNNQIDNNAIYDLNYYGSTSLSYYNSGIRLVGGSDYKLYYNSVSMTGTPGNPASGVMSSCLYIGSTAATNIDMRNNIFYNARLGTAPVNYAIYTVASTSFSALNYNDYFTTGSVFGFSGGSEVADYAVWVTASGEGVNSKNVNPQFNSITNLQPLLGSLVLAQGTPIAGITTDITGFTRSGSAPSMGAYENGVDASGPTIEYTALANTPHTNERILTATIIDVSGVPVAGDGLPRLYWKINAGSYSSVQGVSIGSNQYTFTFGSGVAVTNIIYYYVCAQDLLGPFVSCYPHEGAGGFSASPPAVSILPTTPSSYTITQSFSGIISVGTGGDYLTLTGAGGLFSTINSNSVTGNMTVNILTDITEDGTNALNQFFEDGVGGYTMTIQPADGTEKVISGAVANGMIRFNGADRVTVDGRFSGSGRYLRFRNTNTSNSTFTFINDATNNAIQYCNVEGSSTGSNGVIFFSTGSATGNDNNTITQNIIRDRSDALGVPYYAIYSSGTSGAFKPGVKNEKGDELSVNKVSKVKETAIRTNKDLKTVRTNVQIDIAEDISDEPIMSDDVKLFGPEAEVNNSGNIITSNEIFNFRSYGVYVTATGNGDGWNISNNSFYNNLATPPTVTQTVIYFIPGTNSNGNTLSGNFIGGSSANCGGTPWTNSGGVAYYGMQIAVGTTTASAVSGNIISNISQTSTGAASFKGIYVTAGSVIISSNTIGHSTNVNSIQNAGTSTEYGIHITDALVNITNNEIANITAGTGSIVGIYRAGSASIDACTINNNNIHDLTTLSVSTGLSNTIAACGIVYFPNTWMGNDIVNGNIIYNIHASSTGAVSTAAAGILASNNKAKMTANKIYNIKNSSTGSTITAPPIAAGIINRAADNNLFANNVIALGSSQATNTQFNGIMLPITNDGSFNAVYNSIYIGGTIAAGDIPSFGLLRGDNTGTANLITVNIANNIFYNERTGGTAKQYALANQCTILDATGWGANASNYNLIVIPNSSVVNLWGPTDYNFADWKTNTSCDANSISDLNTNVPSANMFTSASAGDLSIKTGEAICWIINGKGYPIAAVNNDYEGNSRSIALANGPTDIGAYEFTPSESVAPPPATPSGSPAPSTTTTYSLYNQQLGSISWGAGGTPPGSISFLLYTGVQPSGGGAVPKAYMYWNITPTGGDGYSYDITLYYNENELGGIPEAKLHPAKSTDNGVTWTAYLTEGTGPEQFQRDVVNNTITIYGLTSFSWFGLGNSDTPLPVVLSSFTSSVNNRDVKLSWKTESEMNNAGFDVERSISGINQWVKAGYIAGKGNSSSPVSYTFEDKKLNSGKYNYRLKQIDNNGNYEYYALSNVVEVGLPTKFDLSQNYPNPFNPVTKIDFSLPLDAKVSIKLYDITGREVKTLVNDSRTAGYYTVQFNASDLSSGTYFYRIMTKSSSADYIMTKKMVLVK